VDWTEVLDVAEAHGLLGVAAREVASSAGAMVPGGVAAIRDRQRAEAARGLAAAHQLAALVEALRRRGVEALPYKGPALALDVWGDATLRSVADLDIVVAPHDAAAAAAALTTEGYVPDGPTDWRELRRVNGWQGHAVFRREEGALPVELHWRFCASRLPWSPDLGSILARSRRQPIAGVDVAVPATEDQVLLVLLHAARHGWDQLDALACAGVLLARGVNAVELLARARAVNGLRALLAGLEAVRRLFAPPLPPAIVAAIGADARIPLLGDLALARVRAGSAGTHRDARLQYELLDTPAARVRFVAQVMFTPTPRDRALVRLPVALDALYAPLRVARLAWRAARRRRARRWNVPWRSENDVAPPAAMS
jgi:hypothetical protein